MVAPAAGARGARQGQHLIQRRAVGDEFQIDELLACTGETLITQAQPPRQRRRAVEAQALGVGHRDQEQIQRGGARIAAVDEVLLYERLINPAELLGDLAKSLGPKYLLDRLHRGSR